MDTSTAQKAFVRSEEIPYKFLDFFNEEDRRSFSGRDKEITEIVARICQERSFVLYGRSGLGKTSLLLAGVFPGLRERGFRPVYIRLLQSPIQDFRNSLMTELAKSDKSVNAVPTGSMINTAEASAEMNLQAEITEHLRHYSSSAPIVLAFDQFEEFFIRFRGAREERERFIECIRALIYDTTLDIRIVFSLREDYLANLDDMRQALPRLSSNEYRLLPLTAFGTRQAIVQPLLNAGIKFDNRLVSRLVDELAQVNFDPPLMQIICTEVYRVSKQRTQESLRLTEQDLEQVGGLKGIFRRYLDSAIDEIPKAHHLLLRNVLDLLITRENTKRAITREDMLSADFIASSAEVDEVLELLHSHRIIRQQQLGEDVWYELTHERLVEVILDWLQLDREYFEYRVARDLIRNNAKGELFRDRPQTLLAMGAIMDVVGPFKERLRLDHAELDFILFSCIFRKSEQVDYWIQRLGMDDIQTKLAALLAHAHPEMREGAAWTVQRLGQEGKLFVNACLELALHDDNDAVRRHAGKAFGTIANSNDLKKLKQYLNNKQTRRQAIEILADVNEVNRSTKGFSWWQRRRSRKLFERRRFREHAEEIVRKTKDGTIWALGAGVLWTLTTGIILTVSAIWMVVDRPDEWFLSITLTHGIGSVIALLAATLIGWRAARTSARNAAVTSGMNWFRHTSKQLLLTLLFIPVIFFLGMRYIEPMFDTIPGGAIPSVIVIYASLIFLISLVVIIALAKLCSLLVSGFVYFNQYILAGCKRDYQAVAWMLVTSTALPVLITLIVIDVGFRHLGPPVMIALFSVAVISLLVFSVSIGMWRSIGSGNIDNRKIPYFRMTAIATAVISIVILHYHYDLSNTPLWPQRVELKDSETQTLTMQMPRAPVGNFMTKLGFDDHNYHVVTVDWDPQSNFQIHLSGPMVRNVPFLVKDGFSIFARNRENRYEFNQGPHQESVTVHSEELPKSGFVKTNDYTLVGIVPITLDQKSQTWTSEFEIPIPSSWRSKAFNIGIPYTQPLIKFKQNPDMLTPRIKAVVRQAKDQLQVNGLSINSDFDISQYPSSKYEFVQIRAYKGSSVEYAIRSGADSIWALGNEKTWQGKLSITEHQSSKEVYLAPAEKWLEASSSVLVVVTILQEQELEQLYKYLESAQKRATEPAKSRASTILQKLERR